jgi:acetate kinase
MSTRCGDVDPGALIHVMRAKSWGADELEHMLQRESGLLGLSGTSGDMRELLACDTAAAALAVEVFCRRVRKCVGAYAAVMGGLDGVLFGGGIGEHSAEVRRRCMASLEFLGVSLDEAENAKAEGDSQISSRASRAAVWVMRGGESAEMARLAESLPALQRA